MRKLCCFIKKSAFWDDATEIKQNKIVDFVAKFKLQKLKQRLDPKSLPFTQWSNWLLPTSILKSNSLWNLLYGFTRNLVFRWKSFLLENSSLTESTEFGTKNAWLFFWKQNVLVCERLLRNFHYFRKFLYFRGCQGKYSGMYPIFSF